MTIWCLVGQYEMLGDQDINRIVPLQLTLVKHIRTMWRPAGTGHLNYWLVTRIMESEYYNCLSLAPLHYILIKLGQLMCGQ